MRIEPSPVDYEQAGRQTTGFYHRVRTSWERAVEERLFAGVVERFERDVRRSGSGTSSSQMTLSIR
jgi:hypothetical protein